MDIVILVLIIAGAVLMVGNIGWYIVFIRRTRDVLSTGKRRDEILLYLGLTLLIFFLFGYIFVAIWGAPHLVTAFILFFGSIFVSVVLLILSKLIQTSKERSIEIAEVLIGVVDARDPNLDGHSRYVKDVTMLLYRHLPIPTRLAINHVSLEFASLLHDIGKLGIPDSILNKPAKLTDEEWEIMKTHPKLGVKILKPLKTFDAISNWIMYHHERIDGKGYYSIPEDQIPMAAKIIAVADTYAAITMRRSYKEPRTHEEAIAIMKDVAGTQLDKNLVSIFMSIPKEELIACIPDEVKY